MIQHWSQLTWNAKLLFKNQNQKCHIVNAQELKFWVIVDRGWWDIKCHTPGKPSKDLKKMFNVHRPVMALVWLRVGSKNNCLFKREADTALFIPSTKYGDAPPLTNTHPPPPQIKKAILPVIGPGETSWRMCSTERAPAGIYFSHSCLPI